MAKTVEPIQQHADKLKAELVKELKIGTTPDAAEIAAMVPSFSKGTAALDDNTGQPIASPRQTPEFSEAVVAKPEGTETTGATPPTPETPRDDKGRFVGQAPPDGAAQPPAPPAEATQPETPQQAAGAQAAAAAAAAIVDDLEEWEFEDPDLKDDKGAALKIPLRYPKQYHDIVQRSFPRRADYSRLRNRLGEAEPVLRPLIENGSIAQVLPLVQMALADREYADYVWNAHVRRKQGLPLVEALPQPPQPQPAPGTIQPAPAFSPQEIPIADPLLDDVIRPIQTQWQQQYAQLEGQVRSLSERRAAEDRQRREEQQRQMAFANELVISHRDLEQRFPGDFSPAMGPGDPNFIKAQNMARDGGYVQAYGVRGGMLLAYQAVKEIENERLAATASPAAQSLAEVNNRQIELARQQAAAAARTVAGGAPAQSTPPKPRPRPSTTMTLKNGQVVKRPVDEYMADLIAWEKQQHPEVFAS